MMSKEKICFWLSKVLISVSIVGLITIFILPMNENKLYSIVGLGLIALSLLALITLFLLSKQNAYNEYKRLNVIIDAIQKHENLKIPLYEETLLSKTMLKLTRIAEIMREMTDYAHEQKQNIQELVTDISHQVKTPLANIMLAAESLRDEIRSDDERSFYCDTLSSQTQKLESLIESMIKISRLENGHINLIPEKVYITEIINEALISLRMKASEKNIQLEYKHEEYDVFCDRKWTIEALFNVVDNAIKYSYSSSCITITVKRMTQYTCINVADTGIGIPQDHIQDSFRRFYRGENVGNIDGVGVGLYLSREIFTKQGGYITLKSKEDVGTTASIFLRNQQ